MSQYEVKFSCGHTEKISLFGKTADRERKIRWYETQGTCSACYRGEQHAKGPQFWLRQVDSGYELVCWQNSYGIKAELQRLGFAYSDSLTGPEDTFDRLLKYGGRKGWHRTYKADQLEQMGEAAAWVAEQGYSWVATDAGVRSIFDTLVEGRPDLLPGLPALIAGK